MRPSPPRRRATVWPVLLSGLALAALVASMAAFVAVRNYHDDRDRELLRAANSASSVSAYVDLYLRDQLRGLQSTAATPALRSGDPAQAAPVLQSVLSPEEARIRRVAFVALDGEQLARSDLTYPLRPEDRINVSGREYVQHVLRTRQPFVGTVIELMQGQIPAVPLSVPVFDTRGRLTAILATSVRLPAAGDISRELRRGDDHVVVADRSRHIVFSGPEQVSKVTLLDTNLARFADRMLPAADARVDKPAVPDVTTRIDTTSLPADYVDIDGVQHLLAVAAVPTGDWVVLVDLDAASRTGEPRARLQRILGTLGLLLALGMAAVVWAGWRLARAHAQQDRFRRRVSLLAEVAEQAGHGLTVAERGDRLLSTVVPRVADVGVLDCLPDPHRPGSPATVMSHPPGVTPAALGGQEYASVVELPLHGSDGPLGRLLLGLRADTGRPAYGADDQSFLSDVARVSGLSVDHAMAFEREHEALLTYQRGLLPNELPDVPGLRLDPAYRPGDTLMTVGGDWYDAFSVPGGRLGLVIGDVVGHGVVASSAMGQLRSAARALAQQGLGPAQVLTALDTFAAEVTGAEMTTLVYAELDPRTGDLTYSRAGHPPPLLLDSSGRVRQLDGGGGLPLASFPRPRHQERCVMSPGSTLLLFTDGVVERRGEDLGDGITRLGVAAAVARAGMAAEVTDDDPDAWGGRGTADAVLAKLNLAGSDDTCLLVVTRPEAVLTLPPTPALAVPRPSVAPPP